MRIITKQALKKYRRASAREIPNNAANFKPSDFTLSSVPREGESLTGVERKQEPAKKGTAAARVVLTTIYITRSVRCSPILASFAAAA